jgi:uncharacterized sporulation protein YeaH/YhbH (DUF444 family)
MDSSTISQQDWSLHRKGASDQERHKQKIREAIKKNLADIVSEESIILSDGKRVYKVPIRSLEEYRFRYDPGRQQHAGQGDGDSEVGDVIATEPRSGKGQRGEAGEEPGVDYYEAEVTLDELAAMIFEDLGLPFLEEKKQVEMETEAIRFNDIRKVGPMANLDKKRTIMENIKRNAAKGHAHFGGIRNEDLRFKTWEPTIRYQSNAVVIAMMDVSGCHTAGHLIEMADGSYKDVSEIVIGDRVACVNLETLEKTTSTVVETFTKTAPKTLAIETEDAGLRATPEHRYFVYDEPNHSIIEKKAGQLQAGDKLILVNTWGSSNLRGGGGVINKHRAYLSELHSLSASTTASATATLDDQEYIQSVMQRGMVVSQVRTVTPIEEPVQVYDFGVADHHNYIVDGILSHNSMGEFEKYIARSFYFWMVRFLRTKYNNVKIVFISHHTEAKEVTEEEFFTHGESGGTQVSSAYELALNIIRERYNPADWNIYPFHFSDGDNLPWDNEHCVALVGQLMEQCNIFGYGEIREGHYRSPSTLMSAYSKIQDRKFIAVTISDKTEVYPALRKFFAVRDNAPAAP